MTHKVLLAILDGWGIGDGSRGDVIGTVRPEYMTFLERAYPAARLRTDGESVGLPEGQMGNSEVGHLNIGAGRVVYQDLVKINRACRDGSLPTLPEVKAALDNAAAGGKLHLMGLVSDGGVHSSLEHLYALCDAADAAGLGDRTFVHCFTDGRDTDPRSGAGFITALADRLRRRGSAVRIASVVGRYYAMDRDKRWERIKVAYDLLTAGKGKSAADPAQAVEDSYRVGVTDEFIEPIAVVDSLAGRPIGTLEAGDTAVFFNFRNDRARELTAALTQTDMPKAGMRTVPLYFCCMTPYDASFGGLHVLFDKENVRGTIGEWVSSKGLKQLRIAETEKYAHVTFFLNGGREEKFAGEERILVPSPKVATYDLKPQMSAYEVRDALVGRLRDGRFDFVALNFANGDMVGHTGVYGAIVETVKAVDECMRDVVEAAREAGYEVVVIADHGNADHALNADGTPNTAHSTNPVPIVVVSDRVSAVSDGTLADVAPTVLALMGLDRPEEMTGKVLIHWK